MRDSRIRTARILFTLVAVTFLGLVWGAMTSGMLRSDAPGVARSGEPATDAGGARVYRAVLVTGKIRRSLPGPNGGMGAVEIVVPRVGSFRISDSGKGRDLREHIGETVTVMAMSRLDEEGRPILEVDEYSIPAS